MSLQVLHLTITKQKCKKISISSLYRINVLITVVENPSGYLKFFVNFVLGIVKMCARGYPLFVIFLHFNSRRRRKHTNRKSILTSPFFPPPQIQIVHVKFLQSNKQITDTFRSLKCICTTCLNVLFRYKFYNFDFFISNIFYFSMKDDWTFCRRLQQGWTRLRMQRRRINRNSRQMRHRRNLVRKLKRFTLKGYFIFKH